MLLVSIIGLDNKNKSGRSCCVTGGSNLWGMMQVHDKHEELGRSVLPFGRLQHALGQAIFLQRAVKDLHGGTQAIIERYLRSSCFFLLELGSVWRADSGGCLR